MIYGQISGPLYGQSEETHRLKLVSGSEVTILDVLIQEATGTSILS